MITELVSTIFQILVFTLIPFVAYLFINKKSRGFFQFIGLRRSNKQATFLALATSVLFLGAGVGIASLSQDIREIMFDPLSVTGKFREMGFSFRTIFLIILVAGFKTSLSEEILFRGFIAKRLIFRIGYQRGNLLQAFIFGMIHVILFYFSIKAGVIFLIFIFVLSGSAGYLCAYLNEKKAGGSIVPGWIAHGIGNIVSYSFVAFVL